jgi:hypothetical protein
MLNPLSWRRCWQDSVREWLGYGLLEYLELLRDDPVLQRAWGRPLEVFTKMSELGVPASGSKMSARVGEIGDRVRLN